MTITEYLEKKFGFVVKKELGSGYYGIAYLLDDGRVLKVTKEANEAITANKMTRRKFEHIANVYKVGSIKTDNVRTFYWILLEYVPYNGNSEFISDFLKIFYSACKSVYGERFDDNVEERMSYDKKFNSKIYDYLNENYNGDQKILDTFYQFTAMFKEVFSINQAYPDLHSGNIGFKPNGNLCIFDLTGDDEDTSKLKGYSMAESKPKKLIMTENQMDKILKAIS